MRQAKGLLRSHGQDRGRHFLSWNRRTPPSTTTMFSRNRFVPGHRSTIDSCIRLFSSNTVPITYVEPNGTEKTVEAEIGMNLLDVAHAHDIELEGACGGELACSTCHLIFEKEIFDTLDPMEDEEEDMLDLAFEVTET